MKRLLFILLIFMTVCVNDALSQSKSILVFTNEKEAEFIPFVNGKQMSMIPVDTFYMEADTLNFVRLDIHFTDNKTADLQKNISFEFFKHKKFEIVYKGSITRSLNSLSPDNKSDTLYDKFMLKNLSSVKYLDDISTLE